MLSHLLLKENINYTILLRENDMREKDKQDEMSEDLMLYLLSGPVLIGNTITMIKGPAIIILFITDRNRMKICLLK